MAEHASGLTADDAKASGTESGDGEVLYLFCPDERCNWHGVSDNLLTLRQLRTVAESHLRRPIVTEDVRAEWIPTSAVGAPVAHGASADHRRRGLTCVDGPSDVNPPRVHVGLFYALVTALEKPLTCGAAMLTLA